MSVSWSACISTEHIRNSSHPLAALAAAETETLEQHEILALFLLHEYHEPEGPWAPYVCMLPRKLTSTVFWPPALLQQLPRGGALLRETLALKKLLAERFRSVILPVAAKYKGVLPAEILTLPNFLWAIGTVKARNWGMERQGGGILSVLAPVADLVNHHASKGGGARLRPRLTGRQGPGRAGGGEGGQAAAQRAEEAGEGSVAADMWRLGGKHGVENLVFELVAGANYTRGQVLVLVGLLEGRVKGDRGRWAQHAPHACLLRRACHA